MKHWSCHHVCHPVSFAGRSWVATMSGAEDKTWSLIPQVWQPSWGRDKAQIESLDYQDRERVRQKQEGESGGHHRRRSSELRIKEGKRKGRGHSGSGRQWWPQGRARCVRVWLSPVYPVQISKEGVPFGWMGCLSSAVDTCLDQCPV